MTITARNPQKATLTIGDVTFSEKSIKPPSVATTGKLDTSSSSNTATGTVGTTTLKTFIPSLFSEMGDASASVLYDPVETTAIYALVGITNPVVITWADGATLSFTGWLASFEPDDGDTIDATGAMSANITIVSSGAIPVGAEAATGV